MEFVTTYWLCSVICWFSILFRYLASLYAGAVFLLITGRIGISVLCSFNWALSLGGAGFFCTRCLSGVYLQLDYILALPYVLIFGIFP